MSVDKSLFKTINSYEIPKIFDEIFIYLHGLKNVEIAFFLFCLILFTVVVGAPKRGPRAAIAVFIATMITSFGASALRKFISRPYPFLDESLGVDLKVEIIKAFSAFPVISNAMFAAISMSMLFYFPQYTAPLLVASCVYSIMPIYLGVAYPSDAFGSLALGFAVGYALMIILSKTKYFARY